MKFKENAIEPGMVIHCPKEEDAKALLEYLDGLGYKWLNEESLTETTCWNNAFGEGVYYNLGSDKYMTYKNRKSGDGITEFSDLIEPDDSFINSDTDSPMTAKEIICWLKHNKHNGGCADVFGSNSMEYIFSSWSGDTIVEAITAYEAAKKAPKPVELEWVNVARIIDEDAEKCVKEIKIVNGERKVLTERALKEYRTHHEGNYYAVFERRCRVKEDK